MEMSLLNSSAKTVTCISRGLKTGFFTKIKKTQVAFKKDLNKENKQLFGKLIETKKQREERLRTLQNEDAPPEPVKSTSIHDLQCKDGHVEKQSTKVEKFASPALDELRKKHEESTFARSKENISLSTMETMNRNLTPKSSNWKLLKRSPSFTENQQILNTSKVVQKTPEEVGIDLKTLVSQDKKPEQLCKQEVTKRVSVPRSKKLTNDDNILKKSPLLLPDSVIRNISSFPMINLSKTETTGTTELPSKETLRLYPSVSKVLNATMSEGSKAALKRWRTNIINLLGEDGFMKYYKAQLNRGSQFHSLVQDHLSGLPPPKEILDPEVEGCWTSLGYILPNVSDVTALERPVLHSQLLYRGVIDCVARFNGEPVVIEWKKSDKKKTLIQNTYDAPLQMTAYVGALNFDPSYDFKVNGGVVVVAYNDGSPAEVFHLSLSECTPHWSAWLTRLQKYWLECQQQGQQS